MDYKNINVDQYLEILNEKCDESQAYSNIREILANIGYYGSKEKKELGNYMFVIIGFISLILCLLAKMEIGMLLFGFVFFLAGFFIGLFVPKFGLIFLLSHGLSGVFLIFADTGVFSNPVLSDGFSYLSLMIYSGIILIVCGFITTFIYNLSDKVKKIRNFKFVPFSFLIFWLNYLSSLIILV